MSSLGDAGFLTSFMDSFRDSIVAGGSRILPDALAVLGTLAVIDLAVALMLSRDSDPFVVITRRLIKYTFVAWLVNNWTSGLNLTKQWFDTFQYFGVKLALGDGGSSEVDPGAIAEKGIQLTDSLSKSILQFSTQTGVLGNVGLIIVKIIILFVVLACFCWIALQLIITCIEFYLTSAITIVLLPFSVNEHTKFIGEKAIGAVVNFSIKVMVLQAVLCIGIPLTQAWALDINNADLAPLFRAIFGCLALAFISWQIPEYVQGVLSGTPSFSGGDVMRGAKMAAGAATGAAAGAIGGGMRIAGWGQAAMNAPGGRNNDGSANWSGVAKNMGTMYRQGMPDKLSQQAGNISLASARTMQRESKEREAQRSQTTLDL